MAFPNVGLPRKTERNEALVRYVEAHPDATWREVGRTFGIGETMAARIFDRTARRLAGTFGANATLEQRRAWARAARRTP